jgi:hypothetical protein
MFRRGETYTATLEKAVWPEPEVPAAALLAARRALAAPAGAVAGDAGPADRHSPWAMPDNAGRLRP